MRICLFEDNKTLNLLPLNYLRHTSEIICGAETLSKKFRNIIPGKIDIGLHSLAFRKNLVSENLYGINVNRFENDDYLFLNSRVIFTKKAVHELIDKKDLFGNSYIVNDNSIIACYVPKDKISLIGELINTEQNFLNEELLDKAGLKPADSQTLSFQNIPELNIINYQFDLIKLLDTELENDLNRLFKKNKTKRRKTSAVLINKKDIIISHSANVIPGVVIDASAGKVYIGDDVIIEPFTYIKGPVYIGNNSTIRAGSQLYGPLFIGNNCKTSGEIISSVLMPYVNKQHYGFIGHSYLCSWVNLGAGTSTSNLKNNYSTVKVLWNNKETDTKSIFLGSIIGDFTKTGINTMLNTGSIIGISSNVIGSGFQDKFIRSFRWVLTGRKEHTVYEINKALETAKISMERRNKILTGSYKETMQYIFTNRDKLPI
jgi:UDP-N-acetylglucosamine diphosphorylase/glucosamine-1-phosphate N-acetyltransferase